LTLGFDSLDTTSDPYVILRGQAQYLKKINEAWLFSLTFSGQITGSSLGGAEFGILPSEQFPIGGINTIPGYDLNLRRGDNGVNVRSELFYTFLNQSDWGKMQLVPFLAVGKVWNEGGIIFEPQNLASMGLSWNWQWHDWQTNLGVAIPLVVENVPSEFRQEFYFSVQKKFSF
jgi:hemolysin activation/secretion protein